MISTKILAVVMAVIVIAGGVTAVVIYQNNNKKTTEDTADNGIEPATLNLADSQLSPTLEVYGNVNGDMVIDSRDAEMLQKALNEGTTGSLSKYADANYDGTIDAADVTKINQIINATFESPVEVKHLCRYDKGDYYNISEVPINSFVMSGSSNMFMFMKYLGINDQIKGIAYYGKIDATLFPEYQKYFVDYENTPSSVWKNAHTGKTVEYRIGGSAGYFNTELTTQCVTSNSVKALFTCDNNSAYLKGDADTGSYVGCLDEDDAKTLGLGVFRFKSASTDMSEYLSDLALIAFATKSNVSKLDGLKIWCESFIKDLNQKITDHVGVDVKQVNVAVTSSATYSVKNDVVSASHTISSNTSDYTAAAICAGGKFALSSYDFKGSSASAKGTDLGAWLSVYSIDKIIHIKTAAATGKDAFSWYGGDALTSGKSTLEQGPLSFSKTSAYYNNNVYVVCGELPILLRIAYCAVVLYPEVFSASWAMDYNVSHSTLFLGLTEQTVRNGVYYATMSDLGLSGASTATA